MLLIYFSKTNATKTNTNPINASNEVGLEATAEKTKHMLYISPPECRTERNIKTASKS